VGKIWPVQDAKARFSELLRAAKTEPQHITHHGEEAAVIISPEEYRRLTRPAPDRTFYEIWKSAPQIDEFEIPERKGRMRQVKF